MTRFARSRTRQALLIVPALALLVLLSPPATAADVEAIRLEFDSRIEPILEECCSGCHGNGMKKGGIAFDGIAADRQRLHDPALWWSVLKNVRAGIMPPAGKPRPTGRGAAGSWRTGSRRGPSGSIPEIPTPAASRSAGSTGSSTATRSAT